LPSFISDWGLWPTKLAYHASWQREAERREAQQAKEHAKAGTG
jgi:hypothetical protein